MTEQQRKWARDWQRRKRAALLAAARATVAFCPYRQGRYGVCGAPLEISVDRFGRTTTRCFQCERREAGICRDCPRPVEGRRLSAFRCRECKRRALREARARYQETHRTECRVRWAADKRRWRAAHPEESRRRAKAYRKAHPIACYMRMKDWRRRHPEELRLASRRWRRNRMKRLRAIV